MAVWTYEDVVPTLIPNTTMQKAFMDGVHRVYYIKAVDGYVLHDKARDWDHTDDDGNIIETFQGFTTARTSCAANYDFVANPREFFAVPREEVPEDQIFGVDNDHEVA
jgi:hypothetical protein